MDESSPYVVELVTDPKRFPWRVRGQLGLSLTIAVLLPIVGMMVIMPELGMPWEWPLREAFEKALYERSLETLLGALVLLATPFVWLGSKRTLRISSSAIEMSSALPDLLKTQWTDWRVVHGGEMHAEIEVRTPRNPLGYHLVLHSPTGLKRTSVFGWYRTDLDVEGQLPPAGVWLKQDVMLERAQTSPLVAALRAHGCTIEVTGVDRYYGLQRSPAGIAVATTAIVAVGVAVVALLFEPYAYLAEAPWLFVVACALVGAGIAVGGLSGKPLAPEERLLAPVILGLCIALAAWAGAPRINLLLGGELIETEYRFDAGSFHATRGDLPVLPVRLPPDAAERWRTGDTVTVPIARGALGFWQYDRMEARRRLGAGPLADAG